MGMYGEQVLPRIIDAAGGMKSLAPLRRRACEGLAGEVVELGFGPGSTSRSIRRLSPASPRSSPLTLAGSWPASASRHQGAGAEGRARRPVAALPRRQLRLRPVHVDAVHDPRRRGRAGRGAARAQARRDAALRRTRAGPRRRGAAVATPFRTGAEARLRRLPPHPADRRPADRRRASPSPSSTSSTRRARPRSARPTPSASPYRPSVADRNAALDAPVPDHLSGSGRPRTGPTSSPQHAGDLVPVQQKRRPVLD